MCVDECVEFRGELSGVSLCVFLLPCGFWESYLGGQVWRQAPLSIKPSRLPLLLFFEVLSYCVALVGPEPTM